MSADNGIYILETPDGNVFEYRVAHCQAIENLTYAEQNGDPEYVVRLFGDSEVFYDKTSALIAADKQAQEIMEWAPLEYGISTISLPHKFSKYVMRLVNKEQA